VGADWLTVAESADESGRPLVEIVDALIAGELPYLRSGDDPLRWYIAHDQLQFWLARRRLTDRQCGPLPGPE
jgi:hypothetical protein